MGGGGEGSGNLNISIPISVEKSPVQSALSSAVMSSGHQRRTQTSYVGCGAKDAARAKTHFPPRGVPPPGKILEECGDGYAERSTTERRKLSPLALSARPVTHDRRHARALPDSLLPAALDLAMCPASHHSRRLEPRASGLPNSKLQPLGDDVQTESLLGQPDLGPLPCASTTTNPLARTKSCGTPAAGDGQPIPTPPASMTSRILANITQAPAGLMSRRTQPSSRELPKVDARNAVTLDPLLSGAGGGQSSLEAHPAGATVDVPGRASSVSLFPPVVTSSNASGHASSKWDDAQADGDSLEAGAWEGAVPAARTELPPLVVSKPARFQSSSLMMSWPFGGGDKKSRAKEGEEADGGEEGVAPDTATAGMGRPLRGRVQSAKDAGKDAVVAKKGMLWGSRSRSAGQSNAEDGLGDERIMEEAKDREQDERAEGTPGRRWTLFPDWSRLSRGAAPAAAEAEAHPRAVAAPLDTQTSQDQAEGAPGVVCGEARTQEASTTTMVEEIHLTAECPDQLQQQSGLGAARGERRVQKVRAQPMLAPGSGNSNGDSAEAAPADALQAEVVPTKAADAPPVTPSSSSSILGSVLSTVNPMTKHLDFRLGMRRSKSVDKLKDMSKTGPGQSGLGLSAGAAEARGGLAAPLRVLPHGGGTGAALDLVGLTNLGNTCFMNSALQCLRHTPHLKDLLLHTDMSTIGREMRISKSMADLMLDMQKTGDNAYISPDEFQTAVSETIPFFAGDDQHDAQEFLRMLMDQLHDDLNRVMEKPEYEEFKDKPGEPEAEKATRTWEFYQRQNDSPIVDLFCGQLQSSVRCHTCDTVFTCYDPFWDLPVPIPKKSASSSSCFTPSRDVACTLEDCLDAFTEEEELIGDEKYLCTVCKCHQPATKWLKIHHYPKILVLHLKRFSWTGMMSRSKINTIVSTTQHNLDLTNYRADTCTTDPPLYHLYGVANHMGGLGGGHYTATCLNPGDNQWYTYNDNMVNKARSPPTNSSSAYILFYCMDESTRPNQA
mmetsp:Transcript_46284/g.88313  ORF Transcript_46284/g.88313 Transcript_46284/m.88313 type:complete len:1007 (+) Transcript_46284:240-3260(+)|eukprot:CAMPEP_0114272380 /NCGR_PEP_ID=MMETSP0058-20121206/28437_1 /TAXON_ID=36894 /ORGANISM="Pyramimonas parkeae, CCMP726" /LENGTH=1006 /DNA_ID=CAMNT_0001391573 /DNA_START=187 /DNA_END=3207 /DNA_ORIENTATION=-